jgi:hypothetical protein
METNITTSLINEPIQELFPWHKPEIQRLTISLDTALGGSSGIDGGLASTPSDRRLKKDISKIKDALNGILSLNGVTYLYNTSKYPELGLSDEPQIGFIAQELEQVYPQLVITKDNGFKAVNYAQLVPVLVEAIKQQQAMIEDLQLQVNKLQQNSVEMTRD